MVKSVRAAASCMRKTKFSPRENAMLGQQQKLHPRRFRFRHGVTANHDSCPAKPDLCPISRGLGITEGFTENNALI
jgi:hypothetical protein